VISCVAVVLSEPVSAAPQMLIVRVGDTYAVFGGADSWIARNSHFLTRLRTPQSAARRMFIDEPRR
jgi:hypothetical protein